MSVNIFDHFNFLFSAVILTSDTRPICKDINVYLLFEKNSKLQKQIFRSIFSYKSMEAIKMSSTVIVISFSLCGLL